MKRPYLLSALALCALCFGLHASLSKEPSRPSDPLEEDLTRARVEQELMLAERTARMLSEVQEALLEWDAEPVVSSLPDHPAESAETATGEEADR